MAPSRNEFWFALDPSTLALRTSTRGEEGRSDVEKAKPEQTLRHPELAMSGGGQPSKERRPLANVALRRGSELEASGRGVRGMIGFLLKRIGLSLVTLWLLSIIAFTGAQVLPGNVGRAMLGPFADPRAVDALNHADGRRSAAARAILRLDRGISSSGDMGTSYAYRAPVAPFRHRRRSAIRRSWRWSPLCWWCRSASSAASLRRSMSTGRSTASSALVGLSATVRAGIRLRHHADPDLRRLAALAADLGHLARRTPACSPSSIICILPSLPLVLVLFGYIARMARAGMIEALDADYTRTAVLKGLPRRTVIWRHVLRNALLPTITVIATQTGYLIGGLVVIETLFHYQGIGALIFTAASEKDFPMLEAGVLTVGIVFAVATLLADCCYSVLNPRIRFGAVRMSDDRSAGPPSAHAEAQPRAGARCACSLRSGDVSGRRASSCCFWVVLRDLRPATSCPTIPMPTTCSTRLLPPSREHWFGTDQLGRDVFSRVIVGSRDILTVAPLATLLGTIARHRARPGDGLFPRLRRRGASAGIVDALLALPTVIVALLALVALGAIQRHGDLRHRLHLRADHRAHGARGGAGRARARLCRGGEAAAARTRSTSCSSRSCPMCCRRSWSRPRCGSAMRSSPSRR